MSNQNNSNAFKESLKVNTPIQTPTKSNGSKTSTPTPGQRGGQGRTKGGNTRWL